MPFLNKLSGIAKNLGDKASEALEVNKLNSKINAERNAAAEDMRKIGEFFYARHEAGEACDPGVAELLAAIDEHNNAVRETQAEITRIQTESAQNQAARAAQQENARAAAPTLAQDPVMAAATVACPSCGAQLSADAKFCRECGARIEAPVEITENVCPECGAAVPEGGKFCGSCGAKTE